MISEDERLMVQMARTLKNKVGWIVVLWALLGWENLVDIPEQILAEQWLSASISILLAVGVIGIAAVEFVRWRKLGKGLKEIEELVGNG